MQASALAQGPDVRVSWGLNVTAAVEENITAFRVLRGPSPDRLEPIAQAPSEARVVTDSFGLASGEAFWYQVEAVVQGDARSFRSTPVMVSFGVGG